MPLIPHEGSLHLVLGVREYAPFAGRAALPEDLFNADERLSEAVNQALLNKAGVELDVVLASVEAGVLDDFERD